MITSVWEGTDAEWLRLALPMYTGYDPPVRILDATWGNGRFWQNNRGRVTGIDKDTKQSRPHVFADNQFLPFTDHCFDVVVYDPPYVSRIGDRNSSIMGSLYTTVQSRGSISSIFPKFLSEANRVLFSDGLLIAKLQNQIHSGKQWWQVREFCDMAVKAGFTVCDEVIKIRSNPGPQPHITQRHGLCCRIHSFTRLSQHRDHFSNTPMTFATTACVSLTVGAAASRMVVCSHYVMPPGRRSLGYLWAA